MWVRNGEGLRDPSLKWRPTKLPESALVQPGRNNSPESNINIFPHKIEFEKLKFPKAKAKN